MASLIIFLLVAVPVALITTFFLLDESIVNVEPGEMGLLLVHGKATDKWLDPGRHWVPAFRRRQMQAYPSRELSYRASHETTELGDLERHGPATYVVLGDRAEGSAAYTVRFRLDPDNLKSIHNRFGPDGLWSAVSDLTARAVRAELLDESISVDDVYGPARSALRDRVGQRVTDELAVEGFKVSVFELSEVDLGTTGESIQAAVRARLELEREQAEGPLRRERADRDAEVARLLADVGADPALRYREIDAWRSLVFELSKGQGQIPGTPRPRTTPAQPDRPSTAGSTPTADDDGEDA